MKLRKQGQFGRIPVSIEMGEPRQLAPEEVCPFCGQPSLQLLKDPSIDNAVNMGLIPEPMFDLAEELGQGPGGVCMCPQCGHEKKHERGEPCQQDICPECGISMLRKIETDKGIDPMPEIEEDALIPEDVEIIVVEAPLDEKEMKEVMEEEKPKKKSKKKGAVSGIKICSACFSNAIKKIDKKVLSAVAEELDAQIPDLNNVCFCQQCGHMEPITDGSKCGGPCPVCGFAAMSKA